MKKSGGRQSSKYPRLRSSDPVGKGLTRTNRSHFLRRLRRSLRLRSIPVLIDYGVKMRRNFEIFEIAFGGLGYG